MEGKVEAGCKLQVRKLQIRGCDFRRAQVISSYLCYGEREKFGSLVLASAPVA
jgi:hypothetical protein